MSQQAPEKKAPQKPSFLKNIGLAGTAAVITVNMIHPIDVIKTRLQIQGEAGRATKQYNGVSGVIRTIATEEGAAAFYKGIGAAMMREASYTSLRIGLYEPMKSITGADQPGAGILSKFLAGALAGGIGSCAGNPFDVLKTRMMANEGEGRGVASFAKEIHAANGIGGFYKGIQVNIMRACVLNATKMGCYDVCKTKVKQSGIAKDGIPLQFLSALTAGFFMTCTVSPFDIMRTRLMNQPTEAPIYNGFVDCFQKILKTEGPTGFYKGFLPIWGRFAPATCCQLVIFEALRKMAGMGTL